MLRDMHAAAEFQPNQILYLQHQTTRLYAEVIQIVPERQLGWVRPLAMVELGNEANWQRLDWQNLLMLQEHAAAGRSILHDLQQGADLLCPLSLFKIALDVEVVPILTALETFKQQSENTAQIASKTGQTAQGKLREFVYCLWQTYPQAFQP
jgi:hypothetical protein